MKTVDTKHEQIVLGLDLSYTRTGWAIPQLKLHGSLLSPNDGRTDIERSHHDIALPILDIIKHHHVTHVQIEGTVLRSHAASRSGILHGVVRGAIYANTNTTENITPPAKLKKQSTDNGRATKQQMIQAANQHGYPGNNHDEADAWMLATNHLKQTKQGEQQ